MLDGLGDGILPMVVFLEKVRCQNKSGKWITMGLIHFDNFHSKTTSFGPIDPVQVFFNHLDFSKRIKIVIYFYSIHSERVTSKAKQLRSGTMIFFNYIWDALDKRGNHIQDFRKTRTLEGHGKSLLDAQNNQSGTKGGDWAGKRERGAQNLLDGKKNCVKIIARIEINSLDSRNFQFYPLGPHRPTSWSPGTL